MILASARGGKNRNWYINGQSWFKSSLVNFHFSPGMYEVDSSRERQEYTL